MSYGCRTRLSTSELFNYSYSHWIFDGIQQAEEGLSLDRQPWYDESSLYTLCKARAEAVELNQSHPLPVTTSVDTLSTASYHTTSNYYHEGSTSAFPQEVQEEEDIWYVDVALHPSLMHGSGDQVLVPQRATSQVGSTSRMSLDMGDFLGCPMGGGNSNSFRSSCTQGSPSTLSELDGQLSSMESSITGDPTAQELWITCLRRGLMSGL